MKAIKYILFGISLILFGILTILLTIAGDSIPCIVIACLCGAGGIIMCICGLRTPIYKDAEFKNIPAENNKPPQNIDKA